jgi:hypothetical protein
MIFTLPRTNPQPAAGSLLYLNQFFLKNTLLLQDIDTEGIDREQWNFLLGQIKQFIIENDIETVLIDSTANPKILEYDQWAMAPTSIEMMENLSSITTTYILTGDFSYYYNPCPGIIFFPTFLWIIGAKLIKTFFNHAHTKYDTIYDIDFEKKTKTLMSLNMNATWHRIYLFSLLAGKSWFNTIGYSFYAKVGYRPTINFQSRLNDAVTSQFLSHEERDLAGSYSYLLPIQILGDENAEQKRMWISGSSSIDSCIYGDYAINLITETSLTEGILLTEKTCKPFMAYQIPIMVGPVGSSQFLEDIGLDMFGDYIPWKTWDHIKDHKLKIRMIVEFLDSLLSRPTAEQDILSTHQSFKSRLLKNKEYFHSPELERILLQQIKSYTN